jgi:acyl carrier protein phosphodiesterase
MNFLAHLFLDSGSDDALLGSLLGDFVKGDTAGRFSAAVSDAILLHRKIDSFADAHRITRKSRNRISPLRRRFAGIIVEVSGASMGRGRNHQAAEHREHSS